MAEIQLGVVEARSPEKSSMRCRADSLWRILLRGLCLRFLQLLRRTGR